MSHRILLAFQQALVADRVANRFAMEFPSQNALDAYLKKHPKADKSRHSVKEKSEIKKEEEDDKDESSTYDLVMDKKEKKPKKDDPKETPKKDGKEVHKGFFAKLREKFSDPAHKALKKDSKPIAEKVAESKTLKACHYVGKHLASLMSWAVTSTTVAGKFADRLVASLGIDPIAGPKAIRALTTLKGMRLGGGLGVTLGLVGASVAVAGAVHIGKKLHTWATKPARTASEGDMPKDLRDDILEFMTTLTEDDISILKQCVGKDGEVDEKKMRSLVMGKD